jgi:hypothetical protein
MIGCTGWQLFTIGLDCISICIVVKSIAICSDHVSMDVNSGFNGGFDGGFDGRFNGRFKGWFDGGFNGWFHLAVLGYQTQQSI